MALEARIPNTLIATKFLKKSWIQNSEKSKFSQKKNS